MLLGAKSITYPSSTTGIYMATKLFPQLRCCQRGRRQSTNAGVAAVAKGEAEIAIQPVSEVIHRPGTDFVGALPQADPVHLCFLGSPGCDVQHRPGQTAHRFPGHPQKLQRRHAQQRHGAIGSPIPLWSRWRCLAMRVGVRGRRNVASLSEDGGNSPRPASSDILNAPPKTLPARLASGVRCVRRGPWPQTPARPSCLPSSATFKSFCVNTGGRPDAVKPAVEMAGGKTVRAADLQRRSYPMTVMGWLITIDGHELTVWAGTPPIIPMVPITLVTLTIALSSALQTKTAELRKQ